MRMIFHPGPVQSSVTIRAMKKPLMAVCTKMLAVVFFSFFLMFVFHTVEIFVMGFASVIAILDYQSCLNEFRHRNIVRGDALYILFVVKCVVFVFH